MTLVNKLLNTTSKVLLACLGVGVCLVELRQSNPSRVVGFGRRGQQRCYSDVAEEANDEAQCNQLVDG